MPMKMGIHHKPMGHGRLAFLDSRLRGNDGRRLATMSTFFWQDQFF